MNRALALCGTGSIYWNNASTHLYGYSEEEALGRKLEDLIIREHMRDAVIQSTQLWVNDNQKIPADQLILCDKMETMFLFTHRTSCTQQKRGKKSCSVSILICG